MMTISATSDSPDDDVHGLNARRPIIEGRRNLMGAIPEVRCPLFVSDEQINAADKFPPSDDLPHEAFKAIERDVIAFSGLENTLQDLFRRQETDIEQRRQDRMKDNHML